MPLEEEAKQWEEEAAAVAEVEEEARIRGLGVRRQKLAAVVSFRSIHAHPTPPIPSTTSVCGWCVCLCVCVCVCGQFVWLLVCLFSVSHSGLAPCLQFL